jgi:hypothetical protein
MFMMVLMTVMSVLSLMTLMTLTFSVYGCAVHDGFEGIYDDLDGHKGTVTRYLFTRVFHGSSLNGA